MDKYTQELLEDLSARMEAYSNGVLPLLEARGVITSQPTLRNLYDASLVDEKVLEEVVTLTFSEQGVANASTVLNILGTVGKGLAAMFGGSGDDKTTSENDAYTQAMILQQQQEAQAAQSRKKTIMYVGIFIVVVIVGLIVYKIVSKK